MSIQTNYDDWSSSYDHDRNLTRDLDERAARQVLQEAQVDSLLEAGCGTGKNTGFYAQIARRVVALDFSRGMLEQARKKIALPHVHFALADLVSFWPCAASWFDLVTCNLVLEHIEDISFVFAEARRVLKEGGRFLVSELHPLRQELGAQARYISQAGAPVQTQIPAFVHHIPDFMRAAAENGLKHTVLRELRHEEDQGKPPRLAVFLFVK